MKRFMTDWTNKKASMRLTAMLVAVVFAVGTLFVPTGILAAETDEDEITANETVEAVTPAGENEFDEVEASKTEGAEADEAEAGEAQQMKRSRKKTWRKHSNRTQKHRSQGADWRNSSWRMMETAMRLP